MPFDTKIAYLANTPILNLALVIVVISSSVVCLISLPIVAGHHGVRTPIVLPGNFAKVFFGVGAGKIDAYMMTAIIVILIDAVSRSGVAREGHPLGAAGLELVAENIGVRVAVDNSEAYADGQEKGEERRGYHHLCDCNTMYNANERYVDMLVQDQ